MKGNEIGEHVATDGAYKDLTTHVGRQTTESTNK